MSESGDGSDFLGGIDNPRDAFSQIFGHGGTARSELLGDLDNHPSSLARMWAAEQIDPVVATSASETLHRVGEEANEAFDDRALGHSSAERSGVGVQPLLSAAVPIQETGKASSGMDVDAAKSVSAGVLMSQADKNLAAMCAANAAERGTFLQPAEGGHPGWEVVEGGAAAAQKAVATRSMITTLWERVNPLAHEVDELRKESSRVASDILPLPHEIAQLSLEVASLSHVRDLPTQLEQLDSQVKTGTRSVERVKDGLDSIRDELSSTSASLEAKCVWLSENITLLEAQIRGVEPRLAQEAETRTESLRSALQDRIRLAVADEAGFRETALEHHGQASKRLVQQVQDRVDNLERNLDQLTFRMGQQREDTEMAVQRLEDQSRIAAAEHKSIATANKQDLDRFSNLLQTLFEQQKHLLDAADEAQKTVERKCSEVKSDLQRSLGQRLEEQAASATRRLDAQAEATARHEQMTSEAKIQIHEVTQQAERLASKSKATDEQIARMQDDFRGELSQQVLDVQAQLSVQAGDLQNQLLQGALDERQELQVAEHRLEDRFEQRLELGLNKLASEVQEHLQQQSSMSASFEQSCSNRLTAAESWRSAHQERQAAQDIRVASVTDAIQRLEHIRLEIPRMETRLEDMSMALQKELTNSVLSAFQGEMRIWAKMAQIGVQSSTTAPPGAPAWPAPMMSVLESLPLPGSGVMQLPSLPCASSG